MGMSSRRRLGASERPNYNTNVSSALRDLVKAREVLEDARREAKWIRKCKALHHATRAVEVAALAAHRAGVDWNEIGDVLGIERATTAEVFSMAISGVAPETEPPILQRDLPAYDAAVSL
jgi:hypothetical protein